MLKTAAHLFSEAIDSVGERVGLGLQRLGLKFGDTLLVFKPNHIFIPVSYLGTVCIGVAFSGASLACTVNGLSTISLKYHSNMD